jgi:uncharacterized repeat protein (TIGR03803 family)
MKNIVQDQLLTFLARAATVVVVVVFAVVTVAAVLITHSAGAAQSATSQKLSFKTLYAFTGGSDGIRPYAGVAPDEEGNLFGTTLEGGNAGYCANSNDGCGTVFKVDASGRETILHAFTGGPDGGWPNAAPVLDARGNLYGTALQGGNTGCTNYQQVGCGTVFQVDASGKFSVLYTFTGGADGAVPGGSLTRDGSGNLYGTTCAGGMGYGVVFKLDTSGHETALHSFAFNDGDCSYAHLIADSADNIYGTTYEGGNVNCPYVSVGCGVVFKLDPAGNETVLHNFSGAPDGAFPYRGLIFDPEGNLYGATGGGGLGCSGGGCGTVFKVTPAGDETVLYKFQGSDGLYPSAAVLRDSRGNLYGTTKAGGSYNNGVIFKVTLGGKETVLYNFTGGADGSTPESWLAPDRKGNFYGTTALGGDDSCGPFHEGCGTVFEISAN